MRIGVDVGGTKIEGVAMDERSRLVVRERVATPQDDYRATLETIAVVVRRLEASVRRQYLPVGVGHPGAISPSTGLLNNSNSTCLNGRPFQQDLEAVLGHEVYLANDADCLAMSEARDGAAAGAANVFAAILGTGVGGGIAIGGRLLRGPNAIAGEWGHNPLPWIGRNGMSSQAPSAGADAMAASRPGCLASVLCAITSTRLPSAFPAKPSCSAPRPASSAPLRRCPATRTASRVRWRT